MPTPKPKLETVVLAHVVDAVSAPNAMSALSLEQEKTRMQESELIRLRTENSQLRQQLSSAQQQLQALHAVLRQLAHFRHLRDTTIIHVYPTTVFRSIWHFLGEHQMATQRQVPLSVRSRQDQPKRRCDVALRAEALISLRRKPGALQ